MPRIKKPINRPKLRKSVPDRPYHYQLHSHELKISKGTIEYPDGTKDRWLVWDVVPPCNTETCPVVNFCSYEKGKEKCPFMMKYLAQVSDTILLEYGGKLDKSQMMRVGLNLLPLYRMLIRLKMEELVLERIVEKGKVNGIYKELRETIKAIAVEWEKIGFKKVKGEVRNNGDALPDGTENVKTLDYNGNYYELMEKGELPGFKSEPRRKIKKLSVEEEEIE